MADQVSCPPFSPASVASAHAKISHRILQTPLLANEAISALASTSIVAGTPAPKLNILFKCENLQRMGCFKVRGAFHALERLIDDLGIEHVRARGVVTHSSGNHAQSLALASHTYGIPAYIVMPSNATASKVAGTKRYCSNVIMAGTNPADRQAKVAELVQTKGAILVPPYDHPDIILGQGTVAYEISQQYASMMADTGKDQGLRAVIAPLGGGGLLGGTATWFSDTPTYVFGAEPSFEGGNDAQRGLAEDPPRRIDHVNTTSIADGLRTPVGKIPWEILTRTSESGEGKSKGKSKGKGKWVQGVYSVDEGQIKDAMRLVLEHLKLVIEPSSAVPLAVVLYDPAFRQWIWERQQEEGGGEWDIAVIFSGGNTTVDTIVKMFSEA